jgi:hypothetical protein
MPTVSCDGLTFAGLVWTYELLPIKHTETAYDRPSHSPLHFRDQHMVAQYSKCQGCSY